MHQKSGFAAVNGTRIYYELAGHGPPVVLIHGSSLDTRMWEGQWMAFAQHYQVLRYDRRGYGRSALPQQAGYTHHQDLHALLEALGIDSPYLLGHSTGGAVALDFAIAYPETVRALILYGSVVGGFQFSPGFAAALQTVRTLMKDVEVASAKEHWLRLFDFQPVEDATAYATLQRIIADYSGWHWVHADPVQPSEPPAMQQLGKIQVPTLLLLGERDVADLHHVAAILQQALAHTATVVLPNLGHLANMEAPTRFNEVVLDFLVQVND